MIYKLGHIYTKEQYAAIKMNKTQLFGTNEFILET